MKQSNIKMKLFKVLKQFKNRLTNKFMSFYFDRIKFCHNYYSLIFTSAQYKLTILILSSNNRHLSHILNLWTIQFCWLIFKKLICGLKRNSNTFELMFVEIIKIFDVEWFSKNYDFLHIEHCITIACDVF